ncbi:MAG: PKD domain-containing protein [Acidobacteriota bacterium]
MQVPPRLLIVSLLAGLCFSTSIGQQPGLVNIRQRVIAQAPGPPVVNVTVDRSRVPVNYEVTFTLSPASVVGNPKYIVTLQFGDGAQTRARTTQLTHPYGAPGTYTYSVSVTSDPATDPISPRVPQVTLSAVPGVVKTSQPVTFSAQLSENYPNLKYRFVFADGLQTAWQDSSQTTHEYVSPKTYLAYVDIGEATGGSVKRIGGSVRKAVEVSSPSSSQNPTVSLSARPTSIPRRQWVSFAATVVSDDKNVSYRFVFGDGTAPTAWQASSQANHRYLTAGNYSARVEVRANNRTGGQSVSSSPLMIEVTNTAPTSVTQTTTPTPRPAPATSTPTPSQSSSASPSSSTSPSAGSNTSTNASSPSSVAGSSPKVPGDSGDGANKWWIPLLILLAAVVAYRIWKALATPRPTFHPRLDPGVSTVGTERPLSIDFQLELNPDIAAGKYGIESNEAGFIRSERKSND